MATKKQTRAIRIWQWLIVVFVIVWLIGKVYNFPSFLAIISFILGYLFHKYIR